LQNDYAFLRIKVARFVVARRLLSRDYADWKISADGSAGDDDIFVAVARQVRPLRQRIIIGNFRFSTLFLLLFEHAVNG
jgi:hypothetical protein